jgi:SCP-2 sterol transfer family
MNADIPWLSELLAVAESSVETAELPPLEVAFVVSGKRMGLALPPARLTDGVSATAVIEGSSATFQQIVDGSLTPQQAFLAELLTFRGDPEALLRVSSLFESCAGSRRQ